MSAEISFEIKSKIYRDYLIFCLSDKVITDDEVVYLSGLKDALELNDEVVDEIHNEISGSIYQESVEETMADGRLNSDEKVFLDKLQRDLRLPEETAQKIYFAKAKEYLDRYLEVAISDERFSPEEEEEINAISESFGMKYIYDEEMSSLLDRYRLYWIIENENLKDIEVEINLQSNEKCYFDCDVDWYEYSCVTQRIRYSGPMLKNKISKNFYYLMSNLGVQTISDDLLNHIDFGHLFLTNQRLIFMGARKGTAIGLTEILDFIPYKNGVEIQEDSGKNPFLGFDNDIDIFAVTLGRVIQDFGPTHIPDFSTIVELW